MNYNSPIKDREVLEKALEEIRAVGAKYNLSWFFYLTQPGNLASTDGFFQEQIAAHPKDMPNVISDMAAMVTAATRVLCKAMLRFSATSSLFAKPGKEREVQADADEGWKQGLDDFIDGLSANIVIGSATDIGTAEEIQRAPKSEAELRQMTAEWKVSDIQTSKTNAMIHNRLKQIRNAVVWDYYGGIPMSQIEINIPKGSSVSDIMGGEVS